MTTPELKQYIDYMYKSGQPDIEFYEVELYRRTSSSFSIFIMTLIGMSLASRKVRGGMGWHLVLGIGLSALYEVIMKFTVTFATNASLSPFLGVWIPNILYTALAIYLVRMAPK
jgi:lipopolysaccharide export system permease protein